MKKLFLLLFLISIFSLNGCSTGPTHKNLRSASLPKIIPLRDFIANTKTSYGYQLSPDGKKIAWLAVKGVKLAIHFKDINSDRIQTINPQRGKSVGNFTWAQDSRTLFYYDDNSGDENYHIFKVLIDKPKAKSVNLTPIKGIRAILVNIPRKDPDHIYISHNKRDKAIFDLFRLNLKTNKLQLVAENPGDVYSLLFDDSGKVRGRYRKPTDSMNSFEFLSADGKRWKKVISWDFEDSFGILGFSPDPNKVWVLSNINQDKKSLFKMDIRTGDMQLIHREKNIDLDGVLISKINNKPLYARSMPDYPRLHFFDASIESEFKRLKQKYSGYLSLVSADNAERNIVFVALTEKKLDY